MEKRDFPSAIFRHPFPLFGISKIEVLLPLLKNDRGRIQFLRKLCRYLKLDLPRFLI
jgi:hypothetical protein